MAARIISALERQGLTVREAQSITGHAAADFSRLRSGHLARFSVERLLGMAERLGAFGSVLREDFDPSRSDIDLAVEFARSQLYGPADQYFKFKEALEQLLGLEVDLVELRALERVPRFLAERTLQVYLHDEFCQSAVERQLEIAGDALGQIRKLGPELFVRIPEGSLIVAFRNVLSHGYATLDHERVYDAARGLAGHRHLLPELALSDLDRWRDW